MGKSAYFIVMLVGVGALSIARPAGAIMEKLPEDLAEEILSEAVPTVLWPETQLETADYVLEWVGDPIPGVKASLGANSFQWVRVMNLLVLPRARLIIEARDIQAAQVRHKRFSQGFEISGSSGRAELPIALISGDQSLAQITIRRGGRELRGSLRVRFRPRERASEPRVYRDPQCSPFKVTAEARNPRPDNWMFVSCRLSHVWGEERRTASLELFVFWDNVGQVIKVDGIETAASPASLWALRQRSRPGHVTLRSGDHEVTIRYEVADELHLSHLGLGLGPYTYAVDSPGVKTRTLVPLLTVYYSFFLVETMRIVAFNATAFHADYYSDLGVYLSSQSFEVFDRRYILNVMLGGHAILFKANGKANLSFGGPQGFELIIKDFLKRGYNTGVGAFIYPPIDGKSYYNAWLRWGHPGLFAEINYIAWLEPLDNGRAYSRSVGLSLGFPLPRFF